MPRSTDWRGGVATSGDGGLLARARPAPGSTGVRLKAGAFLNLGRDHLDYHPTVEDYLAAKLRLWALLPDGAPVVINRDEPYAVEAAEAASRPGIR